MIQKGNALPGIKPVTPGSWYHPLFLLFIFLVVSVFIFPVSSDTVQNTSVLMNNVSPQKVNVGVYVMDIRSINVADGTFGTNFYLTLKSDSPISLGDIDFMNGHASSIDTLLDSPNDKSFRVYATMTMNPDLRLYPFDQQVLPIEIEPKLNDERNMILSIHNNSTGIEPGFDIAGWKLSAKKSVITSKSYEPDENPYSRAVFSFDIRRDTTSIFLKFFLPILLILIISLSSLMMKGPSRLTLNASMIIVAVFIHWRISDAIPLVAYATFLDMFMVVTYTTITLVLISGILIQKYAESEQGYRGERINYWAKRIIPVISFVLYFLLFLPVIFR